MKGESDHRSVSSLTIAVLVSLLSIFKNKLGLAFQRQGLLCTGNVFFESSISSFWYLFSLKKGFGWPLLWAVFPSFLFLSNLYSQCDYGIISHHSIHSLHIQLFLSAANYGTYRRSFDQCQTLPIQEIPKRVVICFVLIFMKFKSKCHLLNVLNYHALNIFRYFVIFFFDQ